MQGFYSPSFPVRSVIYPDMVGKVTPEDRYYFPTGSVKVPPEGRYYFPTGSVILPHGVVNRWTLPHRAYFSWEHCCQAVCVPPTAASHGTLLPVEGLTFPHRVGIVCLQGRYSKLIAVYLVSLPSWLHTGFPIGSVFPGRSHVPRTSQARSSKKFAYSGFLEVQHSPVPLPGALGTGRGVFSPKCKH